METKKKGFSLVELICVMTIAAIIAVAAAPNVSAYVQNSKLQNYRTALNNLIGELQTQLPENRYWNWEEAHETAEAILRSDAGRTVTETADDVYVLDNVSNDSGVEFKVSLVYEDVTGLNTQKKVTITGECIDFPAVTSEAHECFVNLKGNAVDADGYPMITTLVTSTERGGWKSLQDRIRSYGDWQTWWTDPANSAHNFSGDATFPDQYKHPNTLVVNTTDYAANSVKFIQFRFSYYSSLYTTYDYNSWNHALGDWNKIPRGYMAFPNVDVNNGSGTGAQYDAAKKGSSYHCDNVYVYIGSDSDLDCINFISTDASGNEIYDDDAAMAAHGWVRFDVIFEDSDPFIGKFREYPNPFSDGAKAVRAFKNKYDSTITFGPDGVTPENNTKILYRVNLYNAADAMESSRGWIVVSDSNVYIEPNDAMIYVDNGDIPADTSICQYKDSLIENYYEQYFNSDLNAYTNYYRQTIYLDLAKKGYLPGDELQLEISDVDADMIINGFNTSQWAYGIASNVNESANDTGSYYNNIDYDITKIDDTTICISIKLTWSIYPYLRISFAGVYNPSGADIDLRFNRTTVNTTKIPVTVTYPMVTINGSEDYTIVTFDWSHCDYIDSTNDSSIKLKFNETLSFDVYDKNFNRLTPVTTNTFIPSLYGDAVMNDKIVHLYCKGVNAADIVYEIEAPEPPAVSGTAITTTTTTTTTTTNTTTSTTTTTTTSETTTSTTTTTTTAPATESTTTTTTTKPTTASTTTTTTTTTTTETTTETTASSAGPVLPEDGYTITKTMSISANSGDQIFYIDDAQNDYNITSVVFDIKSCTTSYNQTFIKFANSEDILSWGQCVGTFYLKNYGTFSASDQYNCSATLDGTEVVVSDFNEVINQIIINSGLELELECTITYEPIS